MFEFELSDDKHHLLIRVESKKFDITLAPEFRRSVEQAWDPAIEAVAIDFTSVDFIDSSGVGALVSVHKRAARKGGVLEIHNPGPAVTSIIELLRLHRVFKLVET
ncbi:MAG: STAS domain-containing protein [Myxococcales bacterium]|nr:STAS domain-containing protein [Myxococcales bacterium]